MFIKPQQSLDKLRTSFKMWVFVFYSLALAHGALAEVDCSQNAFEKCETPDFFEYIPAEVSVFKRLCPQVPAYIRCLKEFQDQCDQSRIYASEEEYDDTYGAVSDICEEGTFLNRVATEKLRCFNETFRTTSCPEKVKKVTGPYRSFTLGSDNEDDYTLPVEIMCLQDILESNCIASDIGKNCGKEALEATEEFLRRTHHVEDLCHKNNAKILLRGLDMFELDPDQKAVVLATLETIILSPKD